MWARLRDPWRFCVIVGVLALMVTTVTDAWAQPEPPQRIHVVLFPDRSLNEIERLTLEQDILAGVREAGVRDAWRAERAAVDRKAAADALARNKNAAEEAQRRMNQLELVGALNVLDWAAEEYSTYLPELIEHDGSAARLAEILTLKAIAHHLNEEEEAASVALRRALILDPSIRFDPEVFPPQLDLFVAEQRRLATAAGTSLVRVESKPSGATVFVNGRERGRTPLTVREVPVGPNLIHIRQPGATPMMRSVAVRGQRVVERFQLDVLASELRGPLADSRGQVGDERASQSLHDAAAALGAEALVLVLARRGEGSSVDLVAYVYDMRRGDLVGRSEEQIAGSYDRGAKTLGRVAIEGAAWQPLLDDNPGASTASAQSRPLWKRGYFWTAVGATAGAVVVGVIVASQSGLSNGQKITLLPLVSF